MERRSIAFLPGVPPELGLVEWPGAVAVSSDESTLYVASANGSLAEYDIDAMLDPQRDPSATRVMTGLPAGDARPALAVTDIGPVVAQTRQDRRRGGRLRTRARAGSGRALPPTVGQVTRIVPD